MPRLSWLPILLLVSFAACQHKQTCIDGVCKIVENGKVRYEGDPQKIAAIKQKEAEAQRADIVFVKSLAAAPKRAKHEPVRIAFIPPYVRETNADITPVASTYFEMIRAEMAKMPGIEVVEPWMVESAMQYSESPFENNNPWEKRRTASSGMPAPEPFPYSINGLKKLRHGGLRTDVVVFLWMNPKEKTGFVGGKGQGTGVVQATVVDFQAKFGELYAFKSFTAGAQGNSTSNLAMAGWGTDGKYSKGEMKFKRKVENDLPAIKTLVSQIHSKVQADVRPRLASLTVQQRLEGEKFANVEVKRTLTKEQAVEELKKTGLEKVKSLFSK